MVCTNGWGFIGKAVAVKKGGFVGGTRLRTLSDSSEARQEGDEAQEADAEGLPGVMQAMDESYPIWELELPNPE